MEAKHRLRLTGKDGKSADEIWPDEPAKAHQKDVDARWTLKIGGKVRYRPDGTPLPPIATRIALGRLWVREIMFL